MSTATGQDRQAPLAPIADHGLRTPRIGFGGISAVCSSFATRPADERRLSYRAGAELFDHFSFLAGHTALGDAAVWCPAAHLTAPPGEPLAFPSYQRAKEEILRTLGQGPGLDGLYLELSGAIRVIGLDDVEADLTAAARRVIGPAPLIAVSIRRHGNISAELVQQVDLLTNSEPTGSVEPDSIRYRSPTSLVNRLRSPVGADPDARRPWKAWVPVPLILPSAKTGPTSEPTRSLLAEVRRTSASADITDAAMWFGYPWSDQRRAGCAVLVSADEPQVAAGAAQRLATRLWEVRHDFSFPGGAVSLDEALSEALGSAAPRPFLIGDSGDDPAMGGPGNGSWALGQLLARTGLDNPSLTVVVAAIADAEAVGLAIAAGISGAVDLAVGDRSGSPIRLRGRVVGVLRADPTAGNEVVIRSGSVLAVLTERNKPFDRLQDFIDLQLAPGSIDIAVVKTSEPSPELGAFASAWRLAITPGPVDQDLSRLPYRHQLDPNLNPAAMDSLPPQPRVSRRQMGSPKLCE